VLSEKEKLRNAVISSILSFKAKKVDQLIHANQKEIKSASDDEEILLLMQEHMKLIEVSKEINEHLGRIITK